MSWLVIVLPVIVGIAWAFIPGLAVGAIAGLRRTTLIAVAPLLTMSLLVVAVFATGFLHVRWDPVSAGLVMLVLLAVVAAVRIIVNRRLGTRARPARSVEPRSISWIFVAAVGVAAVIIAIRLVYVYGQPDSISQTFDDVFHLNAVRYILTTGQANPLTIGNLTYATDGIGSFYPDIWHALVVLVIQGSGVSIPVGVNAVNLVIACLVWPLGCVFLIRQFFGARWVPMVVAALLSGAFWEFPFRLLDFGVLYPNFLSIAMVPTCLGLALLALRISKDPDVGRVLSILTLIAVLPGLAMAHPNGFMSFLVLAGPMIGAVVLRWIRRLRSEDAPLRRYIPGAAALLATVIVFFATFEVVRPPRAAATWGPTMTLPDALESAVLSGQIGRPEDLITSALVALGIAALIVTRQRRWFIVSTAAVYLLYVVMQWLWIGASRYFLTGTWYSDINRILAVLPVVWVPLGVFGIDWVVGAIVRASARRRNPDSAVLGQRVAVVTVAVAVVATTVIQFSPAMQGEIHDARTNYAVTPQAPLLSTDEQKLIDRIDTEVPAGSVVAGNPWTGTSLVWALADRQALLPHIYGARSPQVVTIMNGLRDAKSKPKVCDALRHLNVRYVLDFGRRPVFGVLQQIQGFTKLSTSDSVALVDQQGPAAKLYKITACGLG